LALYIAKVVIDRKNLIKVSRQLLLVLRAKCVRSISPCKFIAGTVSKKFEPKHVKSLLRHPKVFSLDFPDHFESLTLSKHSKTLTR
jgi:hypothetical protein